jgi:hypothetical protein
MSISKIRTLLYFFARLLGDFNAIKRGKIGERILRRSAGNLTSRLLNKIFRTLFKE